MTARDDSEIPPVARPPQATKAWPDFLALLAEWEVSLRSGALVLPADQVGDPPLDQLRIALAFPGGGGCVATGEHLSTLPDGSAAYRLDRIPPVLAEAVADAERLLDRAREWLLERGKVAAVGSILPEDVRAARLRIMELEVALSRALAARAEPDVPRDPPRAEAEARVMERRAITTPPPPTPPTPPGLRLPDLDGRPARFSGQVGDTSLPVALMVVALERRTGVLTLRYPDGGIRWGCWSDGGAVGWRSQPVVEEEVLGELLLRARRVTRAQLDAAADVMRSTGCRQGKALVDLGVLSEPELLLAQAKQTALVLRRVLGAPGASWTFHVLDSLPEPFTVPPIPVPPILFQHLVERAAQMQASTLDEMLRPFLDHYVSLHADAAPMIARLRLEPGQRRFVDVLGRGAYRLRDLPSVSYLDRAGTRAVVWALNELGLLELRSQADENRAREQLARMLSEQKAVARSGSYFDRLGLHWICTRRQVDHARARLEVRWPREDPGRFGPEGREALELIWQGIDEAYAALADDASRRRYRLRLVDRDMIVQAAELLASKGEMCFVRNELEDAWDCYARAVELVPAYPKYREGLERATAAGGAPAEPGPLAARASVPVGPRPPNVRGTSAS